MPNTLAWLSSKMCIQLAYTQKLTNLEPRGAADMVIKDRQRQMESTYLGEHSVSICMQVVLARYYCKLSAPVLNYNILLRSYPRCFSSKHKGGLLNYSTIGNVLYEHVDYTSI
jgi:hypothetical protein